MSEIPQRYRGRLPRWARRCYVQEPVSSYDRPGCYLTRIALTPEGLRKAGPIYLDPEREDQREVLDVFFSLIAAAERNSADTNGVIRALPASCLPHDAPFAQNGASNDILYVKETGVVAERVVSDERVECLQLVHVAVLPHRLRDYSARCVYSLWLDADEVASAPLWDCELAGLESQELHERVSRSTVSPGEQAQQSEEKTGQRSDPQAESEQYSFLPLKAVIELHEYELDGFDPQQQLSVLNAALAKVVRATTYRALEASALAYLPTEQLRAIANCIDAVKWWYLALPRQAREPVARLIAQTRADGRVLGYQAIIGVPTSLVGTIDRHLLVLPRGKPRFCAPQPTIQAQTASSGRRATAA